MIFFLLYFLILFLLLIFLISLTLYIASLIYSTLKGSPYVSTESKKISKILSAVPIKAGKIFVELGSGDGRVVRKVVKDFGVKGIGVEINPILLFWSRFLSRGIKNLEISKGDILNFSLKDADYVYLFLMPKIIEKLKTKMEKELKKGVIVISHGFRIKGWNQRLIKVIKDKPFWTFYYRK
ncbi:MAG: hypothetical protein NZL96_03200 [Patescibacteria group bacterium]|nr:hypothetical protein [Patescibacteria group bacterium]